MKVILADDHALVREGLRRLLEDAGVQVIGEASDGHETLEMVAMLDPDVVLMDIGMPGLNGVEATRQIIRDHPHTAVIGLSAYSDKRFVMAMMHAGASGYLLKNSLSKEIVEALKAVKIGRKYLSPAIAGQIVDSIVKRDDKAGSSTELLSAREREVLQLLAEGHTSGQIAAKLHISLSTVDTHRRNIMKKLDLHSIAELTRYAIREGLSLLE